MKLQPLTEKKKLLREAVMIDRMLGDSLSSLRLALGGRPFLVLHSHPASPEGIPSMSSSESVSEWIEDLKRGDAAATARLWHRYHQSLLRYARRRLNPEARRVVDEDDLVATANETTSCYPVQG